MVTNSNRCTWMLLSLSIALLSACSSPGSKSPVTKDGAGKDLAAEVADSDVTIAATDIGNQPDALSDLPPADWTGELPEGSCAEHPGAFGCLCNANDDCLSGFCIFHKGERICTRDCVGECNPGLECAYWESTGPDPFYLCKSLFPSLCLPCGHSAECLSAGSRCLVSPDGQGAFCGSPCQSDDDCLAAGAFECATRQTTEGDAVGQCVPAAGVCQCTEHAVTEALGTPCFQDNAWGSCGGWRTCTDAGLTVCDAPEPAAET